MLGTSRKAHGGKTVVSGPVSHDGYQLTEIYRDLRARAQGVRPRQGGHAFSPIFRLGQEPIAAIRENCPG